MGSIASYPARSLKRRRRAWVRRHIGTLTLLALFAMLIGAFSSVLVWVFVPFATLYVLGALHVALLGLFLHMANSSFLAHDQEAMWQMRGAWGEDNTRTELQRAKRKRLIWDWVDSLELQAGDIDHIVITRRGGVVVLDSKWRNNVAPGDVPVMVDSARRAGLRAEGVLRTLLGREWGARHRTNAKAVTVNAAVVVWGSARTGVPRDASIDGVRLLDGGQLLGWLAELDGHEVSRAAARDVRRLLEDYRATVALARAK